MSTLVGRSYPYNRLDPADGAYSIEPDDAGEQFRYVWSETVKGEGYTEAGHWKPSLAAALRDAADNWEDAGSGGRLAATLRAAATRAERNA